VNLQDGIPDAPSLRVLVRKLGSLLRQIRRPQHFFQHFFSKNVPVPKQLTVIAQALLQLELWDALADVVGTLTNWTRVHSFELLRQQNEAPTEQSAKDQVFNL